MAKKSSKSKRSVASGGYVSWLSKNRWQSMSLLLVVMAAVGIFGAYRLGQSRASPFPNEYFWGSAPVLTRPNIHAGYEGTMKAGYHRVSSQVNCVGYPLGEVYQGSLRNGWWVYLPLIFNKGGWVNELYASGGGNNKSSWPGLYKLYAPGWCS